MGVDYIRSQSGKPHRKRWAEGVDRLKQPTFFDVQFESEARFVTAVLEEDCTPSPGDGLILQADEAGGCSVFSGLSKVGAIADPCPSVLQILADNCGIAPAMVDRLGSFGNTVELRLS